MESEIPGFKTPASPDVHDIELIKEALLLLRSSPPENISTVHIVSPSLNPNEVKQKELQASGSLSLSMPIATPSPPSPTLYIELFPSINQHFLIDLNLQSTINILLRALKSDMTQPMKLSASIVCWQLGVRFSEIFEIANYIHERMIAKGELCFTDYQKYYVLVNGLFDIVEYDEPNNYDITLHFRKNLSTVKNEIRELFHKIKEYLNNKNWEEFVRSNISKLVINRLNPMLIGSTKSPYLQMQTKICNLKDREELNSCHDTVVILPKLRHQVKSSKHQLVNLMEPDVTMQFSLQLVPGDTSHICKTTNLLPTSDILDLPAFHKTFK